MTEVPADVIEVGNRFADLFGDGRQGYSAFDIAVFAIMEERERCAKEIDHIRELLHSQHEVLDIGREDDAYRIASEAIRKGGPA